MDGKIRLNPRDTKNNEARVIYLEGEIIRGHQFPKSAEGSEVSQVPLGILRGNGGKNQGLPGILRDSLYRGRVVRTLTDEKENPVKDKEGDPVLIPNKLFHDFRRTGLRNMVRAGVPERVAMMISGHKT